MTTTDVEIIRAIRGKAGQHSLAFEDGLFMEVHRIPTLGKWALIVWSGYDEDGPKPIAAGGQKARIMQAALIAAKALEAAGHIANQYPDEVFS